MKLHNYINDNGALKADAVAMLTLPIVSLENFLFARKVILVMAWMITCKFLPAGSTVR